MKKPIIALLAAATLWIGARAEDNTNPGIKTERHSYGIDFRAFGALEIGDFDDDERTGAGVGLNYWFLDNIGVGAEGIGYDTDGDFVDRVNGSLLFRAPVSEKFDVIPFGGIGRSIEEDLWGFHLGLRAQAKIYGPVVLDIGGRWVADDGADSRALFDAGIGFSF